MKKLVWAGAALACILGAPAQAEQLTVMTAGDQNMVDYVNEYLGPLFEKQNPGTTVRVVGTGPSDAGSQKIQERFEAQSKAGSKTWDVDVAVVHEKFAAAMVQSGYLLKYRDKIATGKLVTRGNADRALGVPVAGYVMPMFNSQIALAYNADLVAKPPRSYQEIVDFAQAHPKQFGYNGIKGGASGVGFVMGWVAAFAGDGDKLASGPFDPAEAQKWKPALQALKQFNANATLTPGNAGTLDMLSRGEIAMGPVWVDMYLSWKNKGQLPPSIKVTLPSPGMPGQPMHYVIPAQSAHAALAEKFVALATSPQVQAEGIVKRFGWYPGIDADHVKAQLDEATWNKLFIDVPPQDLARYGKPFPIVPYNNAILEAYESDVAK